MCRSEPAPIQTRSWPRSSPAISTCATPGAGNGATPPGSKPVAATDLVRPRDSCVPGSGGRGDLGLVGPAVAGDEHERRAAVADEDEGLDDLRARGSDCLGGGARGRRSLRELLDPRVDAGSLEAPSATRATGSGHCSTRLNVSRAQPAGRCGVFKLGDDTIEGRRRERARAPCDDRSALPGRERANSRERGALRRRRDGLRLRVRRPELHASGLGEPRGVREGACRVDDLPRRPRARGGRHRARRRRTAAVFASSRRFQETVRRTVVRLDSRRGTAPSES